MSAFKHVLSFLTIHSFFHLSIMHPFILCSGHSAWHVIGALHIFNAL